MKKLLVLLGCIPALSLPSQAQLQLPQVLQQPIENALLRNKEIANKQIELEKSALERKSVKSKAIPRLNASAGYSYFDNHVTIDLPGYKLPITGAELFDGKTKVDNHGNLAHAGLIATGVLYAGGQIKNGSKALQEKITGDSLLVETDKDNVIVDVVTSFDKLKFIDASEKLIAESNARLLKEEERVNKAIVNGLAIPFDRDKIKLARLELESKKTQLEENKELLFKKLNYLTGISRDELEKITYELSPVVLPDSLNVDGKQELDALKSYKRASEWLLKKERGTYLPQVIAFGGVSYSSLFNGASAFTLPNLPPNMQQPNLKLNQFTIAPNWIAGVGLRWEIFGGNERKHKVQEAALSIQQLNNKLEDSKDKLNLLLSQKFAGYQTQWKQISLAEQKEVVAKNNLTLSEKQYQQGLISVTQRLEAENDYVKAGQERTEALINQRQAAIEALAVTGRLSEKIQYQ
ncbi:MAG: TolC family protein [Chitinophagaceae bacterium]|nr:TolC family protein [Chitinophagaceae bacterium]